MPSKPKILITGGAGYLAQRMLQDLQAHYEVVLVDVRDVTRDGVKVPGIVQLDLSAEDREPLRPVFRGVQAVIHFSIADIRGQERQARRENSPENFASVQKNLRMAYNVYQTALEEGVQRVIVASSVHATDYHMQLFREGRLDWSSPDKRPAAHEFYGWGKIASEHLGHVYAVGAGHAEGQPPRKLEVIHLRIGATTDTILDDLQPGVDEHVLRHRLAVWLSARDQAQIVLRSLDTADIRDEWGNPFLIVYAISDNAYRFFPLRDALRVLGYKPQDDAAVRFAGQLAKLRGA